MVKVGETFRAAINFELVGQCSSVGFEIHYDPSLVDFVENGFFGHFNHEVANLQNGEPGIIVFGLNSESGGIDDLSGALSQLQFKALKKGVVELEILAGEALFRETQINAEFHGASVEVVSDNKIIVRIEII